MSNALTLYDMSPGLRKVVGRESPRATLAEEPDAGNPLVRIWRGAELGNRSAYSTTAFSTAYPTLSSTPSRRAWGSRRGAVRMAEETDTMLQPTQGRGREGGWNASYKR